MLGQGRREQDCGQGQGRGDQDQEDGQAQGRGRRRGQQVDGGLYCRVRLEAHVCAALGRLQAMFARPEVDGYLFS